MTGSTSDEFAAAIAARVRAAIRESLYIDCPRCGFGYRLHSDSVDVDGMTSGSSSLVPASSRHRPGRPVVRSSRPNWDEHVGTNTDRLPHWPNLLPGEFLGRGVRFLEIHPDDPVPSDLYMMEGER